MTTLSPRQRFLDYVRRVPGARPIVSPFLPHTPVLEETLRYLGLPVTGDRIDDEIRLARALDYEPMFMTDCPGLIFPWREDQARSDEQWLTRVIHTRDGEWVRRVPRAWSAWGGDDAGFPVQTEADHAKLVQVCEEIGDREADIRAYFRQFRERVGEEGVIVIGHPHVTWLAYQIGQEMSHYHYSDYPEAYQRSMDAICKAALFIFDIAVQEGIDFMSESSAGLEFTSPRLFDVQDLPYLRALSDWTHAHGSLFWYHNCGLTRPLILSGRFNLFNADVIETVSPPPEGDNADLAETRRHLDSSICSKGNLSLILLRDGTVDEVVDATRQMVAAVRGWAHIHSTADAVLTNTPPENFIAFVRTAREEAEKLQ
jgi:uroporphyrinogen-III decarboxylase